jgi:hypothetical protein
VNLLEAVHRDPALDEPPVFLPMVRDWQQMADRYTDDELRLIVEFYGRMEQVLRAHLDRLRGPAEPASPSEPDRPAEPDGPS